MDLCERGNAGLEALRSGLNEILEPKSSVKVKPFALTALIKSHSILGTPHITYNGSLTTPPCSQSAIWFVNLDYMNVTYDEVRTQ